MFTTMHSFLLFFIPSVILILLGICFEEKLIAFEQKLFARFSKKNVRRSRPRLQAVRLAKVQKSTAAKRRATRRDAKNAA